MVLEFIHWDAIRAEVFLLNPPCNPTLHSNDFLSEIHFESAELLLSPSTVSCSSSV